MKLAQKTEINEDVITTSTPSPIEQTEAKENAYYDFWGLE